MGFEAPSARRADVITAVGKTFRYADWDTSFFLTDADNTAPISVSDDQRGQLVSVFGYYDGETIGSGTIFGTPESGIAPAPVGLLASAAGESLDAFVWLICRLKPLPAHRWNRPTRDGTTAPLSPEEVEVVLEEALGLANSMRAQIRRPLGSQARVSISVVDTNGTILGFARTRDGPVFGADVSLQKARTAVFFSGPARASANLQLTPCAATRAEVSRARI